MQNLITTKFTNEKFIIDYDAPQMQLIKSTYAEKATNAEFELLVYMSRIYGLDILTRKMWFVKYGNSAGSIFAGRDGFLEIAHRDQNFDGMKTTIERINEPFTVKCFRWENGQKMFFDKTFQDQFVATCQIFRKDKSRPFEITVYEEEYSTGMDNWEKKRRTMISKVAESQALRKAFSISGFYAPEEIPDHGPDVIPSQVVTSQPLQIKPDSMAESADEEAKRLKFIRGKLNQELLKCENVKSYKLANTNFTRTHGPEIWVKKTGHDETETFYSLSMEHGKRIESDAKGPSWDVRMSNCASVEEFNNLQNEFLANPQLETTVNVDLINEKGAFFNVQGYEKTEGAE